MMSSAFTKRNLWVGVIIVSAIALIFLFTGSSISSKQYVSVPTASRQTQQEPQINRTTPICCLILTTPKNFAARAKAINATWGPRCDGYFFITELPKESLTNEEIKLAEQLPIAPIKEIIGGYDHLTQKSTLAFLFAYEHHLNDFDWFIKADDDTYLIVDHLKAFLREQNSSEPVTFGYNFKVIVPKGYHSGGASYVLSRESLRRFHAAHTDPSSRCQKDAGAEDVEVAKCLRTKGVYPGKSLDKKNREIFHPLPFIDHFRGSFPDWIFSYAENPLQTGYNCCSDQSVSFHYISPEEQYLIDFLLYRVRSPSPSAPSRLLE